MKVVEIPRARLAQLPSGRSGRVRTVATAGVETSSIKGAHYARIAGYRVMHTPGLVTDGLVVSAGRIPSATEIAGWLTLA